MRIRWCRLLPAALLLLVLPAVSAFAGKIEKTVPFELDKWIPLGSSDGPVTLHRLKVERLSGHAVKSAIFRPGNTEFLRDVRILIEYSNSSSHDWSADLDIVWLDAKGHEIDGYQDDESLNDGERHDEVHVTLSTSKYGLEQAAKLRIRIDFHPE